MKKIFHINSYYTDNHLYKEIFQRLDGEYEQTVFIPQKKGTGRKNEIDLSNGRLCYSPIFDKADRLFYFRKIHKAFKKVNESYCGTDIIHAHNLSTDGVLAYKLWKRYKTEYIVAIRLTDIVLQYKYFLFRRQILNSVLRHAKKIIFLSPIHIDQLFRYIASSELKKNITAKATVIPNGVNNFWLNNLVTYPRQKKENEIRLLFVGRIVKVKNIFNMLDAIGLLNKQGYNVHLSIIGGKYHLEPEYFEKFTTAIAGLDYIHYIGEIWDKDQIRTYYKDTDIFLMPSVNELFGLTYIEAISQNVPVIYSYNTGISPYLKGKTFAEGVNQLSVESIANGIVELYNRIPQMGVFSDFAKEYDWNNIVNKYKQIYNE